MKVERMILIPFGPEKPEAEITQFWPKGSKFLKFIVLPDGVYTFFMVPDIISPSGEETTFILATPEVRIDPDDEFLDIVTVYSEVPQKIEGQDTGELEMQQATIIFPIFRRKK